MNPDHLKLFVRIAKTHNISSAGKELGISPAVASSHINKLEETLGIRLIHRTTRQVSLTEDGLAFLPHAHNVLENIETAYASVGRGNSKPKGKIRITASASFGRMHLLPAIDGFLQEYPKLQIDLSLSDSIVDIVEGGFDLAIRDTKLNDSTLIARKLASVRRVVCASPEYLAKHGTPTTPDDLNQHLCVNFSGLEKWSFYDKDDKNSDAIHSIKTNGMFKVDNGETMRDASMRGMGISMISLWCCYEQLRDGTLVEVLPEYPMTSQTSIWAVYPSSRMLAPKVRVFIDYLLTFFGDMPYWEGS